jgi:hypothetical protein
LSPRARPRLKIRPSSSLAAEKHVVSLVVQGGSGAALPTLGDDTAGE